MMSPEAGGGRKEGGKKEDFSPRLLERVRGGGEEISPTPLLFIPEGKGEGSGRERGEEKRNGPQFRPILREEIRGRKEGTRSNRLRGGQGKGQLQINPGNAPSERKKNEKKGGLFVRLILLLHHRGRGEKSGGKREKKKGGGGGGGGGFFFTCPQEKKKKNLGGEEEGKGGYPTTSLSFPSDETKKGN